MSYTEDGIFLMGCPNCDGMGGFVVYGNIGEDDSFAECPMCEGSGWVVDTDAPQLTQEDLDRC